MHARGKQIMEYIRDLSSAVSDGPCAVTLGKFDGVHRGHRKLIAKIHELARKNGWKTAVFTFDVAPQIFMGERAQKLLNTNSERAEIMRELNVDILIECPFTEELKSMEADEFVRRILVEKLHARAVVAGTDFHFGRNRGGSPEFLQKAGSEYGFETIIMDKEKDGDRDISSTYIREELAKGNVRKVRELLGYPYFIAGEVIHGRHLGHSLGFPTINQVPAPEKMLPPNGVYFSQTRVGGQTYQGISNIGVKPTVHGDSMGIETYLFDCSLDLYGQNARVELLDFRRPEIRFDSLKELKAQIDRDINAADLFFQPPE